MPNVEKFLQIIMSSTVTLPAEIVDNLYLKKNWEDIIVYRSTYFISISRTDSQDGIILN